jgi:hypothetical protein
MFSHQNTVCTFLLRCTCYVTHPPQSSWSDHLNNIWWGVHSIKFLVMQSSPLPYYLIPLRPRYLPQHPISWKSSAYLHPSVRATKFHTHIKQQAKL